MLPWRGRIVNRQITSKYIVEQAGEYEIEFIGSKKFKFSMFEVTLKIGSQEAIVNDLQAPAFLGQALCSIAHQVTRCEQFYRK